MVSDTSKYSIPVSVSPGDKAKLISSLDNSASSFSVLIGIHTFAFLLVLRADEIALGMNPVIIKSESLPLFLQLVDAPFPCITPIISNTESSSIFSEFNMAVFTSFFVVHMVKLVIHVLTMSSRNILYFFLHHFI